jgi:His-Xaa-Ser system protein HxsD
MIVDESTSRCLRLRLDSALYSEAVVFKCFYWYGKDFDVTIEKVNSGQELTVTLIPHRSTLTVEELERLHSRVRRDLIDFKTRDIVARETRAIRELIVAKAFAHSDEFDQSPIGTIADLGGVELGIPPNAAR